MNQVFFVSIDWFISEQFSVLTVARADSSCILNNYTLHGFSGQSFCFFIHEKYIEFNTVANLIRFHGRRVSRMAGELINVSRMA